MTFPNSSFLDSGPFQKLAASSQGKASTVQAHVKLDWKSQMMPLNQAFFFRSAKKKKLKESLEKLKENLVQKLNDFKKKLKQIYKN